MRGWRKRKEDGLLVSFVGSSEGGRRSEGRQHSRKSSISGVSVTVRGRGGRSPYVEPLEK